MFGRKKKFKFFCVKGSTNPDIMLCITSTANEAQEYINKLLYFKYKQHFESWCFFKGIKEEDFSKYWVTYFNSVLKEEDKKSFWIQIMWYTKSELTAILRMFCGCKPLQCSFELPEEYAYVESKKYMKDLMTEEIVKYLNAMEKENMEDETNPDDKEEMVQ